MGFLSRLPCRARILFYSLRLATLKMETGAPGTHTLCVAPVSGVLRTNCEGRWEVGLELSRIAVSSPCFSLDGLHWLQVLWHVLASSLSPALLRTLCYKEADSKKTRLEEILPSLRSLRIYKAGAGEGHSYLHWNHPGGFGHRSHVLAVKVSSAPQTHVPFEKSWLSEVFLLPVSILLSGPLLFSPGKSKTLPHTPVSLKVCSLTSN